jgi:hypothetical protein
MWEHCSRVGVQVAGHVLGTIGSVLYTAPWPGQRSAQI